MKGEPALESTIVVANAFITWLLQVEHSPVTAIQDSCHSHGDPFCEGMQASHSFHYRQLSR
jgi:hypothetical protein